MESMGEMYHIGNLIPFLRFHIPDMVQRRNYAKASEAAFQDVFETERNEVQLLQEAIALTLQTQDEEYYLNASVSAAEIGRLCTETYLFSERCSQCINVHDSEKRAWKSDKNLSSLWVFQIIGATGFEPATSASRTPRSTKLSHAPPHLLQSPKFFGLQHFQH